MVHSWPVVPLCDAQKRDVRQNDILEGGLYRKCNTYRGGGGYDQFNKIYKKRFGVQVPAEQFVVQLKGCPLSCEYCYVTRKGVYGSETMVSSEQLIRSYKNSGCSVFHLMGGAPALYLKQWRDIAYQVDVFHSDFLLVENSYELEYLRGLPGLHAVSIKQLKEYSIRQLGMLPRNLEKLIKSGIKFYITFTGVPELRNTIERLFGIEVLRDSFNIPIQEYEALKDA